MANRRLIYLDDKDANLLAFKALLRRDFEVFISNNPAEALEMIGRENIAVVIADFKMPQMTGVSFLEQVRLRYPNTVRALLSGHADINAVIESVNKGEVFRFIKKPWIDSLLLNEINSAFELYDARESLEAKNQELERAYQELSHFTYSAAHNLTGPVATIQGLVDLIRTEPRKQQEYIEYLDHTVHVLSAHLRNVISFNQNKANEVQLEQIEWTTFLDNLQRDFRFYPGYEDVEMHVRVTGSPVCTTDRLRLYLVLSNVLVNAIKYSDERKDRHLVEVCCHSTPEGEISVEVYDNGIGVQPENIGRLTEIFFRESTGRLGSGIGLFIASEALAKIGGEMRFESEKGQFTRVIIHIPKLAP